MHFNKLSLTEQKQDLERTLIELGKPFPEKITKFKKKTENQRQNAAFEHKKTRNLVQTKELGLEWTMNGLGKSFKKSNPKFRKTVKIKVKLPHVNKKLARKRTFVQTPFSQSTLKLDWKNFHATKPLAFSLHVLFRRDQNHYHNLTSKIMKMCEQISKKTVPQYNQNSLNCKKTTMSPIITTIASRLLINQITLDKLLSMG